MNKNLIDAAQAVVNEWRTAPLSEDEVESTIVALEIAIAQAKTEKPPQLIVFMEGSMCKVMDTTGKVYDNVVATVDYDQEDECPVCGSGQFTGDDCPPCGYKNERFRNDNAFECVLKVIQEREAK